MYILGISCFYHDAAAALLKDGVLVAAAQEERFTRVKHDPSFPTHAIAFCLTRAAITAADLDYVAFYEKPFVKFERLLLSIAATFPRSWRVFRDAMPTWLGEKLWIKGLIRDRLAVPRERILFVDHHLSHAASALYCSPFAAAAVLTVDGVGEWTTTAWGQGTADWQGGGENRLSLAEEIRFPHSLGLLYSAFTAFLGFEVNEGEYKVMGMAPFGEPKYVDKVERLFRGNADGSFTLDMSYFSYHYHSQRAFSPKFAALFGEPRDPRARFVTARTSLYDDRTPPSRAELERNQYYADVAASLQHVLEEAMVRLARRAHAATGLDALCLAGGVALNSAANYHILTRTPFRELYIQPAAGDAGGALGAALYVYHVILGHKRQFVMDHAAWGAEYGEDAVAGFLEAHGIPAERYEGEGPLLERVVDGLVSGKVVGWCQGRFEWGPRALGYRSILADPRRAEMKDTVNVKIKFREPFRPFAPSVLLERAGEFFALPEAARQYPARFMLYVSPAKRADLMPAATHVDGTGRLQTVSPTANPRYYRLIELFAQATGVPALLNTSFNLKGEPIVATPAEAFATFSRSGMDWLVLGRYLVTK
ncbi:MAG TPA: carbamoyltransferase N-terminal domain-containing protein [Candidatus Binatia bacterium]|nr:carbamoyltransferase N-terminal domain-containing protein [Candidatus Binatia bacterium]